MLGVLITLAVAFGMAGIGRIVAFGKGEGPDPAATVGVGGLIGLGLLGLATLPIGLVPGGFTSWGMPLVIVAALVGLALFLKQGTWRQVSKPEGANALFVLVYGLVTLFLLVAAFAPSDINDWDSLAYHLAVPKQWMQRGSIDYIPSLHHSNFPFTVDLLNVWGLQWGGEAGAKAFELAFFLFGLLAIFGIARARYGLRAGYAAGLAYATVPVILWEAGSAYIDNAHGLFAGLGMLFAVMSWLQPEEKRYPWVAGLLLGFAAGSKYTGLQTIAIVTLVGVLGGVVRKNLPATVRQVVVTGLVASVVAAPWYIKNVILVQNPVYPFFSERLGGKDWDNRRAAIYRNEQQTFGVGRTERGRDVTALGSAVLGLAYQPGRYVNPGQQQGMGSPMGAIGFAILLPLVLWPLTRRPGAFEGTVLIALALSFFLWFFLSQQSRYIISLVPPLAVLLGGLAESGALASFVLGLLGLQSVYSLWLTQTIRVTPQIQVVLGRVTPDEYRKATVSSFAEASQGLNETVKGGKVALYDEVFGYLLDVPYMWANPGHSTVIPYDQMTTGTDYAQRMHDLGFTHVYISLSPMVKDRAFALKWLGTMGIGDPSQSFSEEERKSLFDNWETKWHILIADAVREGRLVPERQFRSGILFRINP